ncbi:Rop family plasmid primer RNA-binding protein, partial [Klebsiella pneumoniae]|nr:Rop family plasmid primer RNA-binding protein [Klebsiella pneumoniae]
LEKLNEVDLDVEADVCEKLHDDGEHLFCTRVCYTHQRLPTILLDKL